MAVERISKRALQKLLSGRVNEPVTCVIKFYSNGCHYCQELKKVFEDIAAESEHDDVLFFAFNISDYPPAQKILKFKGVPTIVSIHTGTNRPRIHVMEEPEKSDKVTWYKANDIRQFINRERNAE